MDKQPVYSGPPPYVPKRHRISAFCIFMRVLAVVSLPVGLIMGIASYTVYDSYGYGIVKGHNHALLWGWILSGVMAFLLLWSLSYIVDACIKYLHKN